MGLLQRATNNWVGPASEAAPDQRQGCGARPASAAAGAPESQSAEGGGDGATKCVGGRQISGNSFSTGTTPAHPHDPHAHPTGVCTPWTHLMHSTGDACTPPRHPMDTPRRWGGRRLGCGPLRRILPGPTLGAVGPHADMKIGCSSRTAVKQTNAITQRL